MDYVCRLLLNVLNNFSIIYVNFTTSPHAKNNINDVHLKYQGDNFYHYICGKYNKIILQRYNMCKSFFSWGILTVNRFSHFCRAMKTDLFNRLYLMLFSRHIVNWTQNLRLWLICFNIYIYKHCKIVFLR